MTDKPLILKHNNIILYPEEIEVKKGDIIYSCGCIERKGKIIWRNNDEHRFFPYKGCPYHEQ